MAYYITVTGRKEKPAPDLSVAKKRAQLRYRFNPKAAVAVTEKRGGKVVGRIRYRGGRISSRAGTLASEHRLPCRPKEGLEFLRSLIGTKSQDCVDYPFARDDAGYGKIKHLGASSANRVMLLLLDPDFDHRGLLARHSCHRPCCCNPNHLSWGSPAENSNDMVMASRSLCGEKHKQAKLTEADVSEIIRLIEDGVSGSKISKQFGISKGNVSMIAQGRTWVHLERKKPTSVDRTQRGESRADALLDDTKVRQILRLSGKVLQIDIAKKFGVSPSTIRKIQKNKSWRHIPRD